MTWTSIKHLAFGLAASAALFLTASLALADKVVCKDGRVFEGTIVEEQSDFVKIKLADGKIEWLSKDEIKRIDRDEPKADPKTDPKPEAKPEAQKAKAQTKPEASSSIPPVPVATKKEDKKKREGSVSGATRVAILDFGAPSGVKNRPDDMVGVQCNVASWRNVIPLLEKDNVDVVVIRINSGGGLAMEVPKFHDLYEKEYKRRWRTVGWVESAISAAAMAPYVLEEFYFLPEGNLGACTMFSGPLILSTGWGLVEVLHTMEEASKLGKRDSGIMRAMQYPTPLTCNIDEFNNVTWFQGAGGKYLVNPGDQILTLNAQDAMKYGFAKGIAATKEELAKAMGLNEVEWVGKAATDYINRNMRENDRAEKKWRVVYDKYLICINGAMALRGPQNKEKRVTELGLAKRYLNELEAMMGINPNLPMLNDLPGDFFERQREIIKQLLKEE